MEAKSGRWGKVLVFAAGVILFPWLGVFLDQGRGPVQQQESLGWLFFILAPLLFAVVLRLLGRDWADAGLRPRLLEHLRWYGFALFFHPLLHFTLLGLGAATGILHIPDPSPARLAQVGMVMVAALGGNFLKNIFEESGWRGYLTPKLQVLLNDGIAQHLVTGLIWFAWHLPYYLVLLPPETLRSFADLPLGSFLALGLLSMLTLSIVYGELRLRSASLWPAVLIHTTTNAVMEGLLRNNFYQISPTWEALLSPGLTSLASSAVFLAVGLWLYRSRRRAAAAALPQPQF